MSITIELSEFKSCTAPEMSASIFFYSIYIFKRIKIFKMII